MKHAPQELEQPVQTSKQVDYGTPHTPDEEGEAKQNAKEDGTVADISCLCPKMFRDVDNP